VVFAAIYYVYLEVVSAVKEKQRVDTTARFSDEGLF
jgi:hypothetical protein